MFKKIKIIKILAPVIILAGAFSVNAQKPSIKALTSGKSAEKQASHIPSPRIMGQLKRHSVGVGIGQTFLKSDFKDNGEDKITWDLFYNYSASHSFDFLANFHISEHEFQSRKTTISGLALGIKAKVYQLDAFSPFLTGGLGFYQPTMTRNLDGNLTKSESKLTFGFHFGGGGELRLNDRVTVGVMGQFHNPFDIRQESQPEVEGSYFKLLLISFYTF
jgi:hypothetical protein